MFKRRIITLISICIIFVYIITLRFSLQSIPKEEYKRTAQMRIIRMTLAWSLMTIIVRYTMFSINDQVIKNITWAIGFVIVITIYVTYQIVYLHYWDVVRYDSIPVIRANSSMFNDEFTLKVGTIISNDLSKCFMVEDFFALHYDCQIQDPKIKFWHFQSAGRPCRQWC